MIFFTVDFQLFDVTRSGVVPAVISNASYRWQVHGRLFERQRIGDILSSSRAHGMIPSEEKTYHESLAVVLVATSQYACNRKNRRMKLLSHHLAVSTAPATVRRPVVE